jgi:DNA-binding GntR family transcriptional regulator
VIDEGVGLAQLIKDYLDRDSPSPYESRSRVIVRILRAMIDDGIFAPDDLLPTTRTLVACFKEVGLGISAAGFLKAFQRLRAEGVVYSRNRAEGTRLKDPRNPSTGPTILEPTTPQAYAFDNLSRRMRLVAHFDVISANAPQLVAGLLGQNENVLYRARVLGERDRRDLLHQAWVPAWVSDRLPVVASRTVGAGGLDARIENEFGSCVHNRMDLRIAAEEFEARRLEVPVGTELLVAATVTIVPDGQRPALVTMRAMSATRFEGRQLSGW